jgi:hypothetical protein
MCLVRERDILPQNHAKGKETAACPTPGYQARMNNVRMQIQINTDHHIEGHEALAAWATGEVKSGLGRFSASVTRVEVHLSDENGHKSGPDGKRCVMEARIARPTTPGGDTQRTDPVPDSDRRGRKTVTIN